MRLIAGMLSAGALLTGCAVPSMGDPKTPVQDEWYNGNAQANPQAAQTMQPTEVQPAQNGGDVKVPMEEVIFRADGRDLHGFLAKPAGPGPFPVFIFNHGSEPR